MSTKLTGEQLGRAASELGLLAREIPRFCGRMGDVAADRDPGKRRYPTVLVEHSVELAHIVCEDEEASVQAGLALQLVCEGDRHAEKLIAGAFPSVCVRLRLANALKRHPKAPRCRKLIRAIGSGAFDLEQLSIATTMADEVRAAEGRVDERRVA